MAYQEPSVIIYQEILSYTPPALYPDMYTCIVGPAYKVVKDEVLGEFTKNNKTFDFSVDPTTKLDLSSIKIKVDGYIERYSFTDTNANYAGTNKADITDSNFVNQAKVGDVVFVLSSLDPTKQFQTKITAIQGNTYYFKDVIPSDATYDTLALADKVNDYVPNNFSYSSMANTITLIDSNLIAGTAYISYRALRLDLAGAVNSVANIDEVEGQLGVIDPVENPLAYGVYKALQNTITPVKYYAINEDSPIGYTAALDVIGEDDQIYAVVPLTNDMTVLTAYKNWAEQMSLPEIKKYKIILGNIELPYVKQIGPDINATKVTKTNNSDGTITINYSDGTFIDSGVTPGDYYVEDQGDGFPIFVGYKVLQVLTNTDIIVEGTSTILNNLNLDETNRNPRIVRKLTKDQQAEAIKDQAKAFGSKRFVLVFPDLVHDGDFGYVPGYYAAAAIAGMVSGFPPQKGFTNVALVGFDGAKHTNGYFRRDQLNVIAEGGVLILANAAPVKPTAVYIRHQLTTDPQNVYTGELSAVKNIDFLSLYFKKYIEPFLGKWNLVDETIEAIRTAITLAADRLMNAKISKLGAPLTGYQIIKLEKTEADKLDIQMKCDIPLPLNYVYLHLQF